MWVPWNVNTGSHFHLMMCFFQAIWKKLFSSLYDRLMLYAGGGPSKQGRSSQLDHLLYLVITTYSIRWMRGTYAFLDLSVYLCILMVFNFSGVFPIFFRYLEISDIFPIFRNFRYFSDIFPIFRNFRYFSDI
jgi:hypothetical protein